jgi:hypothetical protein
LEKGIQNNMMQFRHKIRTHYDSIDESTFLRDDVIQVDSILDELLTENADADKAIRLDKNAVNQREKDILKAAKHAEEAMNMREYCLSNIELQ